MQQLWEAAAVPAGRARGSSCRWAALSLGLLRRSALVCCWLAAAALAQDGAFERGGSKGYPAGLRERRVGCARLGLGTRCRLRCPGRPPPQSAIRREEVAGVFNTPLLELVYHAASVHRMYNDPSMVGSPVASLVLPVAFPGCGCSSSAVHAWTAGP